MSKPNKITTVSFICKLGEDTLKLVVLQSGDRKPEVLGAAVHRRSLWNHPEAELQTRPGDSRSQELSWWFHWHHGDSEPQSGRLADRNLEQGYAGLTV